MIPPSPSSEALNIHLNTLFPCIPKIPFVNHFTEIWFIEPWRVLIGLLIFSFILEIISPTPFVITYQTTKNTHMVDYFILFSFSSTVKALYYHTTSHSLSDLHPKTTDTIFSLQPNQSRFDCCQLPIISNLDQRALDNSSLGCWWLYWPTTETKKLLLQPNQEAICSLLMRKLHTSTCNKHHMILQLSICTRYD